MDDLTKINEVIQAVELMSTQLVHAVASDSTVSDTLIGLFDDGNHIHNCLRFARQWPVSIVESSDKFDPRSLDILSRIFGKMTNFLDTLLLVTFKGDSLTNQFCSLGHHVQSNILLAVSISIQCLLNVLSSHRYLNLEPHNGQLNSLLSVFLTGSRAKFILSWSPENPLVSCHRDHLRKLTSYFSLLLHNILLNYRLANFELSVEQLSVLGDKIIQNPGVLATLCQMSPTIEHQTELSTVTHCRLLLLELSNFPVERFNFNQQPSLSLLSEQWRTCVMCTGLILCLRHCEQQIACGDSESSTLKKPFLPSTVSNCLLFWSAMRSQYNLYPAQLSRALVPLILKMFRETYSSWHTELQSISDSSLPNCGTDFMEAEFPYASLRGLVHVLSEILSPESGTSSHHSLIVDLTEDESNELWDLVCNVFALSHACFLHLQKIFPPVESETERWNRDIGGTLHSIKTSPFAVPQPLIDPSSALSPAQLTGFKQDCIRCLVGLLSHHPSLIIRLVSHQLQTTSLGLADTITVPPTFEVLLEHTNRDPRNPFAVEWVLLLIKLLLQPDVQDDRISDASGQLAQRFHRLKPVSSG